MAERPFSQGGRPIVVAHRGASADAPENTLAAFEAAIAAGADAIELDVRLSADGVPVVAHDATLGRTAGVATAVATLTAAQLANVRIRGSDTGVPTFREVLEALSGRVALDVELKNAPDEPDHEPGVAALVSAVAAVLERSPFAGEVLLSSFDPLALEASRRRLPEVPTGLLTAPDVDAVASVVFARDRGHAWALPFVGAVRRAGPEVVERAHAAGVRLGTWLTDEPSEAVELFRWGVDAVATNDPAPVVAAVREAFGP